MLLRGVRKSEQLAKQREQETAASPSPKLRPADIGPSEVSLVHLSSSPPPEEVLPPALSLPLTESQGSQKDDVFKVSYLDDEVATVFSSFKATITNLTQGTLLFKVQTTMPNRYHVVPHSFGILDSLGEIHLELFVMADRAASLNNSFADASVSPSLKVSTNHLTVPPLERKRSGSGSRSIGNLLQYRPKDSVEDIAAESAAAITEDRFVRRSSYLTRKSSSSFRSDALDSFVATKRAMLSSMGIWPEEELTPSRDRSSSVFNDDDQADRIATRDTNSVYNTNNVARGSTMDMLRIEARCVEQQGLADDVNKARACKDSFRRLWSVLTSSKVTVIPIKSEVITTTQVDELLRSAEVSIGIPSLQNEKLELQFEVQALTRLLSQLEEGNAVAAHNRAVITKERLAFDEFLQGVERREQELDREKQLCLQQHMVDRESIARLSLEHHCWTELRECMLAAQCALVSAQRVSLQRSLEREEESTALKNRYAAEIPLPCDEVNVRLVSVLGTEVAWWIAAIAVFAAVWSNVMRPLLGFGF